MFTSILKQKHETKFYCKLIPEMEPFCLSCLDSYGFLDSVDLAGGTSHKPIGHACAVSVQLFVGQRSFWLQGLMVDYIHSA